MSKHLFLTAVLLVLSTPVQGQETLLDKLREQARSSPRDAAVHTELGHALLKAGRLKEAEAQLTRAARLRKNSLKSQYELAKVKFASGNYRVARAACRSLAEKNADAPLTHVCLARAFLIWKRSSRAFEALEKALSIDPNNLEALLVLGEAHRLRGSYTDSQEAYQRVIQIAPNYVDAYLGLGRLNAISGRKKQAEEFFRKALEKDCESPVIQFELGRLVGGQEGLNLINRALRGRPNWNEAELVLGELSLALGHIEKAQQSAEIVLKRSPNLADAYALLGKARFVLNDLPGAEKALRKALKLVPNLYVAALTLADVLAKAGNHEEALEQYRSAADLAPQDSKPLVQAALLGKKMSRNALAAGFLTRALERNPDSAEILALYADVLMARNDKKQALQYYQRALKGQGNTDRAYIKKQIKKLK